MKNRTSAAFLFVPLLLLSISACDRAVSDTPGMPTLPSIGVNNIRISTEILFSNDEVIRFSIKISNCGPRGAELHFRSGQVYEVEVCDKDRKIVWNWSRDKGFTLALWVLKLAPGEVYTSVVEWNRKGNDGQNLPSGTYDARVFLVDVSPPPEYSFKIRI